MILPEELTVIGEIIKTHGINGELSATMDPEVDPDELRCIVLTMDGIPVPFFIENWRTRGSESILLTLEGIESDSEASLLTGKEIFAFKKDLPENENGDGFFAGDLIGWTLKANGSEIGTIENFDDSTINLLLIVRDKSEKNILIPLAEEFITGLDFEKKIISMDLPDGLLTL